MSYNHYDRMSALDAAFLTLEDENAHMHIGSVALFDAEPLTKPGGGIDFDRILAYIEAVLPSRERFRQKLARVPVLQHPVWVDDERFNLRYHVRHVCLPAPGDERQLKRLAGRIMSEGLDRAKPLWELWIVEGVTRQRFAVVSKIHHSLADGISSVGLLAAMLRADARHEPAPTEVVTPRPAPRGTRLLLDELSRRATLPVSLARATLHALTNLRETAEAARDIATGLVEVLRVGALPASVTPFNQPLGPHRRFDWTRFDLEAVEAIRRRFGGTLNDVVLCVVAGAIDRFFTTRGWRAGGLDFRVLVPVAIRSEAERRSLGNRVSMLLMPLPLEERDPRRRLKRVSETTRELKESKRSEGVEAVATLADWTLNGLLSQLARFALKLRIANMVVTNVPGPRDPVHLLGARMLAAYPVVPLGANQSLGVAVLSYAGGLYWGFNADWDAMPYLHEVVRAVEAEFEALSLMVPAAAAKSARKRTSRPAIAGAES